MNKLTNLFSIALIGMLLLSAATGKRKFEGDLQFQVISFASYYGADSAFIKKFDQGLDSLSKLDKGALSESDLEFVNFFNGLKKHGLIDKPYFYLANGSTTYTVYTSPAEYSKVEGFKWHELVEEKKKVHIELTGKIITIEGMKVISCSTIDRVEKVDGVTLRRK